WGNADLPCPDFPGLGRAREHARYLVHEVVRYHDFHLDLREEVHRVLATSIELGVALLTAKAPHLRHRHSDHPDAGEGLLHVVELEWLDDGLDLFHFSLPAGGNAPSVPRGEDCRAGGEIRNLRGDVEGAAGRPCTRIE